MQPARALFSLFALMLATAAPLPAGETAAPPAGRVEFSDGSVVRGALALPEGKTLRLLAAGRLHTLRLDQVAELRFGIESESMEREWRHVEAGQTRKEHTGAPYPVRRLTATAISPSGARLTGTLQTTPLYVDTGTNVAKIVIASKLRGAPGQSPDDLVHPVRVIPAPAAADAGAGATAAPRLRFLPTAPLEAVAVGTRSLARLPAEPDPEPGRFRLPILTDEEIVLAVRATNGLVVGWPAASDPAPLHAVTNALPHVRDFFDTLEPLAARAAPGGIYSLMRLTRAAPTTLGGPRPQPWRLELWRWARADNGSLTLTGRGWFFRGLTAPGAAPPPVRLTPTLCPPAWTGDLDLRWME